MRRSSLPLLVICLATLLCLSARAADAPWKPAAGPLMTRWAKDVSPEKVHPEYPRPQMVREKWTNLNGLWDYAIRPAAESKRPEKYDGQILVPFPIESALSGVMKRVGPDDELWYHRALDARKPEDGSRVLLHFGAVDWQCDVFVNGKSVGTHTGGYDPFTFDITDALTDGQQLQELLVAVSDPTDANWQPRGKQVNQPKGIWYTPTTGIWQTVWLEVVPASYIRDLRIVPDLDKKQVRITADVVNPQPDVFLFAEASLERKDLRFRSRFKGDAREIVLEVGTVLPWSPESPTLYDLKVWLSRTADEPKQDEVASYFAMRKISLGPAERGVTRMCLNNEPLFQYGPLDQGFWPDGLYTAPTDEALKYDLDVTKKLGFNMVRKHVKVEPARWYYHCDKLGLLVWQDMPSGDKHAPWDPVGGHNGEEIQRSKESAENFKNEWREIMTDLAHFPCIVVWVPFNEAWGQFDTVGITQFTQELDPTRLVNCASGGNDFPIGHISDLHRYPGPAIPRLERERAAVLGEYGGLGLPLEGHTWQAKDNWGYRSFKTREELADAYEQLLYKLRVLVGDGLSAAIYTQTTDVEVEVNGLLTYDREVLKIDAEKFADLHAKLHQPLKQVVLVPNSRREPQTWRYTTDKPADGWEKPEFGDASWREGPGGFGEPLTPGSRVRTEWKTADIWLRRTIELPKEKLDNLALSIHHDEETEIYLNGKQIASVKGFTTNYTLVPLDEKTLAAALQDGKNTLALHCHQTGGGQYIDVGLVRLEEAEARGQEAEVRIEK